jgi:small subunit ribosomal protein S9
MENKIYSGKRKEAIAKAKIKKGTGEVSLNKRDYKNFEILERLRIEEPLAIAKEILGKIDFDLEINISGGGRKGQIEAARLAMSKAILGFTGSKELEKIYLEYDRNLLVADVRRKEAYKPGVSKARKKRQTSYR